MERVHKKFCKWVLNVKQSTNTLALYGELGRFPLYIERNIRMVKYFLKVNTIKSDNCILNVVLHDQIDSVYRDSNTTNWASNIRDILQSSGLNEVWLYPSSVRISLHLKLKTMLKHCCHISIELLCLNFAVVLHL